MKWVGLLAVGLGGHTLAMVGHFWLSPTHSSSDLSTSETRVEPSIEALIEGAVAKSSIAGPRLSSEGIRSLAQAVAEPADENE